MIQVKYRNTKRWVCFSCVGSSTEAISAAAVALCSALIIRVRALNAKGLTKVNDITADDQNVFLVASPISPEGSVALSEALETVIAGFRATAYQNPVELEVC